MGEYKGFDELMDATQERMRTSGTEREEQFLKSFMDVSRAFAVGGPPPSRRRPRREEALTYRVRVEIADTKPPVSRELELASDLFLDEVHDIIQTVFAWRNSRLHRFAGGPAFISPETEHYLAASDVVEGQAGVPEAQVRLDEVLVETGDHLLYLYDFVDNWEHVLTLQAVSPKGPGAPRAVCTGGSRDTPPEGCGGARDYELVLVATDPEHPDQAGALTEYKDVFDEDPEPLAASVPFDIDAVNAALRA